MKAKEYLEETKRLLKFVQLRDNLHIPGFHKTVIDLLDIREERLI